MCQGRMRIGVQLPEVEWEVPFPELIAMAQTAEAVGFDSLWLGNHLLYELEVGDRGPWEVWTSLAAIAASTSTIGLGPLVASRRASTLLRYWPSRRPPSMRSRAVA